jgi:glycosyltransferase involved in cell wall biosynthesis
MSNSERVEGGRRLYEQSKGEPPLISIISVVFRARQQLPALLSSIFRLKSDSVELIVVDGGSDDGTREFLLEHNQDIDYWLSERDGGIYDAMNKGIAASRGTFLFHLNAGDKLLDLPLRELELALESDVAAVAFRVSIDGELEFKPSYGLELRFNNTLHHQGTFYRRDGFPTYDTGYKVFADFDVNQKLALRGSRVALCDRVVALHGTDGVSGVGTRALFAEFFGVIARNHGWSSVPIAWILCKGRGLKHRLRKGRTWLQRRL